MFGVSLSGFGKLRVDSWLCHLCGIMLLGLCEIGGMMLAYLFPLRKSTSRITSEGDTEHECSGCSHGIETGAVSTQNAAGFQLVVSFFSTSQLHRKAPPFLNLTCMGILCFGSGTGHGL